VQVNATSSHNAAVRTGPGSIYWLALIGAAAGSCGGSRQASVESGLRGTFHTDGGCTFTIDSPPLQAGIHVPVGTAIQWDSNPPSSGEHYPIWAAYQTYASPVPRGYYVHNLEHGAVVFLYNCPSAPCPDVASELEEASAALPDDALCTQQNAGVRARTIVTPDPLIDVEVAAAAWGWTYKADCVDLPSLEQFASQHYGQGPEAICSDGTTQF